ncbi:hypothetical protein NNB77_20320, partial [Escherichia fergusonii]|uniref:hypothetical protein n=1 Tax=Escherichia fergusonii TaxID=564 RepID=UPI0020CFB2D8
AIKMIAYQRRTGNSSPISITRNITNDVSKIDKPIAKAESIASPLYSGHITGISKYTPNSITIAITQPSKLKPR